MNRDAIKSAVSTIITRDASEKDKLEAYSVLSSRLQTVCTDAPVPQYIFNNRQILLDSILDSICSQSSLTQSSLQMLGYVLFNELLARSLDKEIIDKLMMVVLQMIKSEETTKVLCTRALWCLSNQNIDQKILKDYIKDILSAIQHLKTSQLIQTASVSSEIVGLLYKLYIQCQKEFTGLIQMWYEPLVIILFTKHTKVQQKALAVLTELEETVQNNSKAVAWLHNELKNNLLGQIHQLLLTKSVDLVVLLKIWSYFVRILGKNLHRSGSFLNDMLRVVEQGFKHRSSSVQMEAYLSWRTLIDDFSLESNIITNHKRVKLLLMPLVSCTVKQRCAPVDTSRVVTWWYLITSLLPHLTFETKNKLIHEVASPFLLFCLGIDPKKISSLSKEIKTSRELYDSLSNSSKSVSPSCYVTLPQSSLLSTGCLAILLLLGVECDSNNDLDDAVIPADPLQLPPNSGSFSLEIQQMFMIFLEGLYQATEPVSPAVIKAVTFHVLMEVSKVVKTAADDNLSYTLLSFVLTALSTIELDDQRKIELFCNISKLSSSQLLAATQVIKSDQLIWKHLLEQGLHLVLHNKEKQSLLNFCNKMFFLATNSIQQGSSHISPHDRLSRYHQLVLFLTNSCQDYTKTKDLVIQGQLWCLIADQILEFFKETGQVSIDGPETDFTIIRLILQVPFKYDFSGVKDNLITIWKKLYYVTRVNIGLRHKDPNFPAKMISEDILSALQTKVSDYSQLTNAFDDDIFLVDTDSYLMLVCSGLSSLIVSISTCHSKLSSSLHLCIENVSTILKYLLDDINTLLEKLVQHDGSSTKVSQSLSLPILIDSLSFFYNILPIPDHILSVAKLLSTPLASLVQNTLTLKELSNGSLAQEKICGLWKEICTCFETRYKPRGYTVELLKILSPLLEVTFLCQRRDIVSESVLFWGNTFGKESSLVYPNRLRTALTKFLDTWKSFDQMSLPNFEPLPLEGPHPLDPLYKMNQLTEGRECDGVILPVNSCTALRFYTPPPPITTATVTTPVTKSTASKLTTPTLSTPTASRVRRSLEDDDTQDYVAIAPPVKKRRLLTEHQKDKRAQKNTDIPVLYNAIEPSMDTQDGFTEESQHTLISDSAINSSNTVTFTGNLVTSGNSTVASSSNTVVTSGINMVTSNSNTMTSNGNTVTSSISSVISNSSTVTSGISTVTSKSSTVTSGKSSVTSNSSTMTSNCSTVTSNSSTMTSNSSTVTSNSSTVTSDISSVATMVTSSNSTLTFTNALQSNRDIISVPETPPFITSPSDDNSNSINKPDDKPDESSNQVSNNESSVRRKRGRPRKNPLPSDSPSAKSQGRTRKHPVNHPEGGFLLPKRGRPRKNPVTSPDGSLKRRRLRKSNLNSINSSESSQESTDSSLPSSYESDPPSSHNNSLMMGTGCLGKCTRKELADNVKKLSVLMGLPSLPLAKDKQLPQTNTTTDHSNDSSNENAIHPVISNGTSANEGAVMLSKTNLSICNETDIALTSSSTPFKDNDTIVSTTANSIDPVLQISKAVTNINPTVIINTTVPELTTTSTVKPLDPVLVATDSNSVISNGTIINTRPLVSMVTTSAIVSTVSNKTVSNPVVIDGTPVVNSISNETPVVSTVSNETPVVSNISDKTPVASAISNETLVASNGTDRNPVVNDETVSNETPVASAISNENLVASNGTDRNPVVNNETVSNETPVASKETVSDENPVVSNGTENPVVCNATISDETVSNPVFPTIIPKLSALAAKVLSMPQKVSNTSLYIPSTPTHQSIRSSPLCGTPVGILKYVSQFDTPLSVMKSRHVQFADPVIMGEQDAPVPHVEEATKTSKNTQSRRKSPFSSRRTLQLNNNAIGLNKVVPSSELPSTPPSSSGQIFPPLADCDSPVEQILPSLSPGRYVRGLYNVIHARNITTIGNLSSLSEQEVNTLPIRSPKVSVLRTALRNFENTLSYANNKKKKPSKENNGRPQKRLAACLSSPQQNDSDSPVDGIILKSPRIAEEDPLLTISTPDSQITVNLSPQTLPFSKENTIEGSSAIENHLEDIKNNLPVVESGKDADNTEQKCITEATNELLAKETSSSITEQLLAKETSTTEQSSAKEANTTEQLSEDDIPQTFPFVPVNILSEHDYTPFDSTIRALNVETIDHLVADCTPPINPLKSISEHLTESTQPFKEFQSSPKFLPCTETILEPTASVLTESPNDLEPPLSVSLKGITSLDPPSMSITTLEPPELVKSVSEQMETLEPVSELLGESLSISQGIVSANSIIPVILPAPVSLLVEHEIPITLTANKTDICTMISQELFSAVHQEENNTQLTVNNRNDHQSVATKLEMDVHNGINLSSADNGSISSAYTSSISSADNGSISNAVTCSISSADTGSISSANTDSISSANNDKEEGSALSSKEIVLLSPLQLAEQLRLLNPTHFNEDHRELLRACNEFIGMFLRQNAH